MWTGCRLVLPALGGGFLQLGALGIAIQSTGRLVHLIRVPVQFVGGFLEQVREDACPVGGDAVAVAVGDGDVVVGGHGEPSDAAGPGISVQRRCSAGAVSGSPPVSQECPKTGANRVDRTARDEQAERSDLHILDATEQ